MKSHLLSGLVVAALLLSACRERGRPDPAVHMAPSHDVEQAAGQGGQGEQKVPTRLEVPPEVQAVYSGVRLSWKDSGNSQEGVIEVPLGGVGKVPGSDLEVRGDVFLPAFSMAQDAITSSGIEESNPAARIAVAEKGAEIFAGWIFTRFPDVHPFQHPRISLRLMGGVRKAPAKKK